MLRINAPVVAAGHGMRSVVWQQGKDVKSMDLKMDTKVCLFGLSIC